MNDHLLNYVRTSAWAMEPNYLERCLQVLNSHLVGEALSDEAMAAVAAAKRSRELPEGENGAFRDGAVAVIPVTGIIARHANQVQGLSGPTGTSVETIQRQVEAALEDPAVEAIMLMVDSPGGSAAGVAELGDVLRAAREQKPLHAHGDGLVASAAYWLASSTSRVSASRSTDVGSIGVYSTLVDSSEFYKQRGFRVLRVRAGKHKGIGLGGVEISDEDRAVIQENVDDVYVMFVADVAAGRRMSEDRVLELADGRVHVAHKALGNGLIDAVETFGEAMAALRAADRPAHARAAAGQRGRAAALAGEAALAAEATDGQENGMSSTTAEEVIANVKGTEPDHQKLREEAVKEAVSGERARTLGILAACASAAKPVEMAVGFIESGATKTDALEAVNAELHARMQAAQASPASNADKPLGAGNAGSKEPKKLSTEERIEKEWADMPKGERARWANDQEVFALQRAAELGADAD